MANDKNERKIRRIDAICFDIIVMAFFLLLAVMSVNYNPRARSIPLVLGIVGTAMMFLQLLVDVSARLRSRLKFVSESGLLSAERKTQAKEFGGSKEILKPGHEQAERPSDEKVHSRAHDWWRVFRVILWLVGFIVLLTFSHYLVAVSMFVLLMTRLEAKESWKRSITLALCVNAAFYLLFNIILKAQL